MAIVVDSFTRQSRHKQEFATDSVQHSYKGIHGYLVPRRMADEASLHEESDYFNFAYSALAAMRMGTSGSASFQRVKKS